MFAPGFGVSAMVQPVPSQCIASVTAWVGMLTFPTAHMSLAATPDTPTRMSSDSPPPRFGDGTTVHFFPFQCSVSVVCSNASPNWVPTAQTLLDDVPPTPWKASYLDGDWVWT